MRTSDALIQSQPFRDHLAEADAYATANNLDTAAAKLVWIALRHGIPIARRYAVRRSKFRTSRTFYAYTKLVETGIFVDNGIAWNPTEPWDSDPLRWFNDLCHIATGSPVPNGFPTKVHTSKDPA